MIKIKLSIGFSIFIVMVCVFIFNLPTPKVTAEAVGDQLLAKGCWRGGCTQFGAGFAQCTCTYLPSGAASSTIRVPYPRLLGTSPKYGLVGVPFLGVIDWNPGTTGWSNYSSGLLYVAERSRYTNFNSELKLSIVDTGDTLNESAISNSDGVNIAITDEKTMGFTDVHSYNTDQVVTAWNYRADKSGYEDPGDTQYGLLGRLQFADANSALMRDIADSPFSPSGPYLLTDGGAPTYFVGYPVRSSQNDKTGSTYMGEKAFGFPVKTSWYLYAHVSWSSYEEYEHTHDDCSPVSVPTPKVGPKPTPSMICTPVWEWVKKSGSASSQWVKAGEVVVDYVYDTRLGGYYHNFAYPVYQSQPLLQVP